VPETAAQKHNQTVQVGAGLALAQADDANGRIYLRGYDTLWAIGK